MLRLGASVGLAHCLRCLLPHTAPNASPRKRAEGRPRTQNPRPRCRAPAGRLGAAHASARQPSGVGLRAALRPAMYDRAVSFAVLY
jgi:hypothetical protein